MPHAARLSALLLPIALLSLALRHGHHGSQALAARSLTLVPAQQRLLLSPPPKVKPPAPKPPPSPRRPPPPRPSPPKPVVAAVAKPAPSLIKAVLPLRSPPPPSPSPSSPPTPFPPGITTYPGQLLDLSNWKVQLPTPGPLGVAEETVKQPQLASYIQPLYFYPTAGNTAVAFVANAGGATTSGSKYARSELQEVVYSGRGGAVAANWNISGPVIHTMTFTGATLRLPPNRPCTVLAQIKGFTDVAAHVRISGSYFGYKIQVAALNSTNLFMLDASYKLGTPYTIRIAAGQDRIQVFYNDMVTPAVDLFHTAATADPNVYFKVGNYLQTNPSTGENPAATAEVWLYSLQLSQA